MLLGARRAAEGADAAALAPARVAAQVAARPAEPLGAAADQRGVRAGQLGGTSATPSVRSTRVEHGRQRGGRERRRGRTPRCQRASTRSGVRKQVPELTSVVPPSPRPSGSTIGGRPSVAIWPPSRYSRAIMSRGRPVIVRGRMAPALLEHDDARAALGELLRDDGAAGAGADDADVGAQRPRRRRARGGSRGRSARRGVRDDLRARARARARADLAHARRGVVAERRHHPRVAVVAHDGGRAQRLGELRHERDARALQAPRAPRAGRRGRATGSGAGRSRARARAAPRRSARRLRGGAAASQASNAAAASVAATGGSGGSGAAAASASAARIEASRGAMTANPVGRPAHASASSSRCSCALASAVIAARAARRRRAAIAAATAA